MDFLAQYWYMFFLCVGVAALAMSAGIGGATFYVPFILLVLKVPVRSAIAIGIFVEIFGFAAGVYDYARAKKIDYALAKRSLVFVIPAVLLGVALNRFVNPTAVEYIFVLALMIFATQLLLHTSGGPAPAERTFDLSGGFISALGGLMLGFLSSGLGESNEYNYFSRLHRSPVVTAATSVLVVALGAITATAAQVYFLLSHGGFGGIAPYTMLIAYSVLGAIVGAKLGSVVVARVNRRQFRAFIGVLLYLVAAVSLYKVLYIG